MTHKSGISGKTVTKSNILHHGIDSHPNPPLCLPRLSGNCVMTQKQRSTKEKIMHTEENNKTSRAINRLTVAVWVLCLFSALHLAVYICIAIWPIAPKELCSQRTSCGDLHSSSFTYDDPYEGFHDWPLEKQIKEASVIAVTRCEEKRGQLVWVFSEILKQDPDATFFYKVGDVYDGGFGYPDEYIHPGDGQIIFYVGSPASMKYASTFSGDRIDMVGGVTIEKIREKVAELK